MTTLPYSFDLLYDLKTVEQLHDHLTGRQRYATSATDFELIALAQDTGVPLPPELNVEAPIAVAMKARGARVPATATHYMLSNYNTRPGGITMLAVEFFRELDDVWQKFTTDGDDEYPQWQRAAPLYKGTFFVTDILPRLRVLEGNK